MVEMAGADPLGGGEQGEGLLRDAGGPVSVLDAVPAPRRAQVLAEELAGVGVEQAHVGVVPLDVDATADPSRRRPVVGGRDLDAAVQVHGCGGRTGSSGMARAATDRGPVFLRRTWWRPGAWSCRGCGCRPSAAPSGRGGSGRRRGPRSGGRATAFSGRGRRRLRPCPSDRGSRTRHGRATTP